MIDDPVKPGDPLTIQASTWNAMMENLRHFRRGKNKVGLNGTVANLIRSNLDVLIYNAVGEDLFGMFRVVRIGDPSIDLTTNPLSALRRICLDGLEPNDATNTFAILQEPLAEDNIGTGIIQGLSLAFVQFDDPDHEFCNPTPGNSLYLTSSETGSARIIWSGEIDPDADGLYGESYDHTSDDLLLALVFIDWESGSSGGGGSLSVGEQDGTPIYTSIDTILFYQDRGFEVTNPVSGTALVSIDLADELLPGIISAFDTHSIQVLGNASKAIQFFMPDHATAIGGTGSVGLVNLLVLQDLAGSTAWHGRSEVEATISGNNLSISETMVMGVRNFNLAGGYTNNHYIFAGYNSNTNVHGFHFTTVSGGTPNRIATWGQASASPSGVRIEASGFGICDAGGGFVSAGGTVTTGGLTFAGGLYLSGTISAGGVSDGNKGDITVSGSGTTWAINNSAVTSAKIDTNAVTFAKIQNITTDRLLGRDTAATGNVEEITVGGGIEFTGSTGIRRSELTGDVSASAGSGTTLIGSNVVTYAKMQDISITARVIGRKTAGAGDPEECSLSEVMDFVGSAARGDIFYRNATIWTRLPAGTSGRFLKTLGAGADPIWDTVGSSANLVPPGGRLTLSSGVPVTNSDVTSTTVYYTPYLSGSMTLYDGSAWVTGIYSEVSIALGTVTSNLPYDIFGYLNAGVFTLEKVAWTNTTTRATALTIQDGVYVKSGDATRRYLGTIHTSSTTQTIDSKRQRLVWNMYNRILYEDYVSDPTDNWTDAGNGSWSAVNGGASYWIFDFVRGLNENQLIAEAHLVCGNSYVLGLALDGGSPDRSNSTITAAYLSTNALAIAKYSGYPGIGKHSIAALESTWAALTGIGYGDNSGTFGSNTNAMQSGMFVRDYR